MGTKQGRRDASNAEGALEEVQRRRAAGRTQIARRSRLGAERRGRDSGRAFEIHNRGRGHGEGGGGAAVEVVVDAAAGGGVVVGRGGRLGGTLVRAAGLLRRGRGGGGLIEAAAGRTRSEQGGREDERQRLGHHVYCNSPGGRFLPLDGMTRINRPRLKFIEPPPEK